MESNGNGNESNVIPIETVKGASASKRNKPDIASKMLGKRPSSKQLRETLSKALPVIKAHRRDIKGYVPNRGYTPAIGELVLSYMSEGYTLTETCDKLGIARSTAHKWMLEHPSFRTIYAQARVALAEHSFSEALAIPRALYARVQAGEPIDGAAVASARLLTDSLKWYAERLNPKDYAPQSKASLELSGTMAVASVVIDSRALSPDARDALRYALQAANAAPVIEHDEGEGVDD